MPSVRAAFELLWKTPHYVLGRFHTVRATYSGVRRLREQLTAPAVLGIGERYATDSEPLPIRSSGLVASTRAAAEHVQRLRRDAYSDGLQLTEAACAALVAEAKQRALSIAGGRKTDYEQLSRDAALRDDVAVATVEHSAQIETIRALAGDPLLLTVVERYLGYRPERVSPWLFWSPRNALTDAEREARFQTVRFHYDVHHYNFMYVNFYLLDTSERTGAHMLIAGSHRDKRPRHLLGSARISDAQALADYGAERIRTLSAPAAHGFFEDTSCYHKALPPLDRERLMLQLRYQ